MTPKYTCLIIVLLLTVYTSLAQTKKADSSANLSITDKVYGDTTDEYKLPDPNDIPAVDEDHTVTTQTTEYISPVAPTATHSIPEPAQPAAPAARKMPVPVLPAPPGQKIYHYPEYMPRPTVDLKKYFHDNAQTPADEKKKGIHGTVIVNFIINEDGSLSDFNIRKSLSGACDAAAISMLRNMPHWRPGMSDRKIVKTWYEMPVVFE